MTIVSGFAASLVLATTGIVFAHPAAGACFSCYASTNFASCSATVPQPS
ncbi:hypothetical protein FHT82_001712 [Rhizobium sp. BK275]|nr:hypothetical protein [Rhizobium sp. BK275]MBB3408344.1 hypothetical protein [Rhizobium sp. BK316]